MADLHEVTFRWPRTDASDVICTGTFDQWSSSIHLSRTASGFESKFKVPWSDKVFYKFIVDGKWTTAYDQPTEYDSIGNLNNVYHSPSKP
ncbi:carbohydrate-binding module family 48 protein, partial [Neolentinus lepideus HHB14362 ss-1]